MLGVVSSDSWPKQLGLSVWLSSDTDAHVGKSHNKTMWPGLGNWSGRHLLGEVGQGRDSATQLRHLGLGLLTPRCGYW